MRAIRRVNELPCNELPPVNPSRRYLLISPCRDEAQYLRRTLDSVAAQSVRPALWVVVNDGSTDETPAILEEYTRRLPYLRVVRRTDRGRREVGPGVIEAFYAGLETVRLEDFDYLCKLDMDLDLPVRYFEALMQRMESDPRVGTTSGKPWFVHPQSGALVSEICGDEMSVGMTKFYRVACFKEDRRERRSRAPPRRPSATASRQPKGHLDRAASRRVRTILHGHFAPLLPDGCIIPSSDSSGADRQRGHAVGLPQKLARWLKGLPRYDDLEFRRFLQSYQHACLRMGKRAASARVDAERARLWHATHPAPESC